MKLKLTKPDGYSIIIDESELYGKEVIQEGENKVVNCFDIQDKLANGYKTIEQIERDL